MKKRTAMPFYGKFEQMLETEGRKAMQANDRETANKFFEGAQARLKIKQRAWAERVEPMVEFNKVVRAIGRMGDTRKDWYAPREGFRQRKPKFFVGAKP